MPAAKTLHFNPPGVRYLNKTRCGRILRMVEWRLDIADITCNRCLQLNALDHQKGTD